MRNLLQMRSQIPKNLLLPYIALGVGTFALSFAAMYVRWAQAPGVVTGFYRLFLSSLVLLPFLVVKRNTTKAEARWMDMLPPILSGMCMAVNFALWNTSLAYTTVANASVLGSITPIWVSLVAWTLFRERLNHRFWMGLLTMFAGIILITSSSSLLHPHLGVGDMLAAVASIFSAGYILITQLGRQRLSVLTYVWINGASASVWILLIVRIFHYPLTGFPLQTWVIFACAAIITQLVGYTAISFSLGKLPASVVSPTLNLQPVLTILLAIPLLGEIPNFPQAMGCALALAGVFLINQAYQQGMISIA